MLGRAAQRLWNWVTRGRRRPAGSSAFAMDARSPGAPRRARAANRQRAAKRSDCGPSRSYGSTFIAPANVTRQVYGNGVMLVGFGLDEQLREPVEVHCYYTTGFLITLRRAPSPALDALRQAGSVQPQPGSDPIRALHPLISSLYTQFSALALELDERLDALEQRVLHEADDQELAEITAIRRRAAVTRRILTPGRDLAARTPLIQSLPGATSETQLYGPT